MSQRDSGYARRPADHYPTPAWVAQALDSVLPLKDLRIWEPAAGDGTFADSLAQLSGRSVIRTDIRGDPSIDFTAALLAPDCDAIITNPPYGHMGKLAEAFIRLGQERISHGILALLLPADFDAARSRRPLFDESPMFRGRVTLTKRVKWFDGAVPCRACAGAGQLGGLAQFKCKACRGRGHKHSSPSQNHAWFVWTSNSVLLRSRTRNPCPPVIWYAP